MSGIIKKTVFGFIGVIALCGSAWGGWFTFEPNVILINGTPVARELENIQMEHAYLEKGDLAHANQLIKDSDVYIIEGENGKTGAPVKYVGYEEYEGSVFVRVKNESGTQIWANMLGLVCKGQDGKERKVTKQDLEKGEFETLSVN
ncbi:MAG: hypothetical protein KJ630_11035 [Proteobacteria bacterium]|nr:hypothetical protein [Pseudomonadota bacterium]